MKSLKKVISFVLLMCTLTALVSINAWADDPVLAISGSSSASMAVNEQKSFSVTVTPDNGEGVSWHVNDTSAITPNPVETSAAGSRTITITAAKAGSFELWASVGASESEHFSITVTQPQSEISLPPYTPYVYTRGNSAPEIGETVVYQATVDKGYDNGRPVTWNIYPQDGTMSYVGETERTLTLKAEKAGTVKVWASLDGYNSVEEYSTIPEKKSTTLVSSVQIKNPGNIYVGTQLQMDATVLPGDADNKKLYWTSNKPNIINITEDGYLTALQVGTNVTITAYATDGSYCNDTIVLNVLNTNVSISSSNGTSIPVGGTTVLTAIDYPDRTQYGWTWTVTEEAAKPYVKLTPDANGGNTAVVEMLKSGRSVTIQATNTNGKSATITLNPTSSSKLTLSTYNLNLSLNNGNGYLQVYYNGSVIPGNYCTWECTDQTVVAVNQGTVTPLKAGTAYVRAKYNGETTEACTVTVGGTSFFTITAVSNNATFDGVNPLYFVTSALYTSSAYPTVTIVGANNVYSRNLVYGSDYRVDSSSDGHMMITVNPTTLHNLPQADFHNIAVSYGGQIAYARFWRVGSSYNVYGVRTGDDSNAALWGALCLVSFIGAAAITVTRRRDLFEK